jgi:hypothetical protein
MSARERTKHGLASLLLVLLSLFSVSALAHQSSVVFLQIVPHQHSLTVTLRIANSDLYEALGLPSDRPISRAEAVQQRERLAQYVLGKLAVTNLGWACPGQLTQSEQAERQDGFFVVETLEFECPRAIEDAALTYHLFFDLDPRHQGLAQVVRDGTTSEHIFREGNRTLSLKTPLGVADYALDYLRLGVEHIFTGYDHLAFLIGLLLLAGSLWRQQSRRRALGYILRVVTAFTVAHSVTLLLSALGLVSLPSRLVESAIALSIGYIAVENIVGVAVRFRSQLAFGFGLIHGLGFASVLRELGLPAKGLVTSLLCFNLGVELGQLTVVLVVLPLLVALSLWRRYQRVVVQGGSLLLLMLSLLWFVARAFDMQWPTAFR